MSKPARQIRKRLRRCLTPIVQGNPRIRRHIGNRLLAREELDLGQTHTENTVQTLHFVLVARGHRWDALRKIAHKHIGLALQRPDATHLKHQPLQDARAALGVGQPKRVGLFRQIHQDRVGLEHREIVGRAVDDGRDAAVAIDLEERRLLLALLADIDHFNSVWDRISSRAMETSRPFGVDQVYR